MTRSRPLRERPGVVFLVNRSWEDGGVRRVADRLAAAFRVRGAAAETLAVFGPPRTRDSSMTLSSSSRRLSPALATVFRRDPRAGMWVDRLRPWAQRIAQYRLGQRLQGETTIVIALE